MMRYDPEHVLLEETDYFDEKREELRLCYPGKWLVVKGRAVIGGYPDFETAYEHGLSALGNVPMLIRHVDAEDRVIDCPRAAMAVAARDVEKLRAEARLANERANERDAVVVQLKKELAAVERLAQIRFDHHDQVESEKALLEIQQISQAQEHDRSFAVNAVKALRNSYTLSLIRAEEKAGSVDILAARVRALEELLLAAKEAVRKLNRHPRIIDCKSDIPPPRGSVTPCEDCDRCITRALEQKTNAVLDDASWRESILGYTVSPLVRAAVTEP